MAYVIVCHKDRELLRRELKGTVQVGRSPECEVSVRDVLLSRRHCAIEPAGGAWVLSDLGSKNGTCVAGDAVSHRILRDNDVIHLGKTTIRFLTGPFVPPAPKRSNGLQRPADPFEALAGTVADFVLSPPAATCNTNQPMPRPTPREPASYAREEVRSLVSELVSSSWDSIYEHASRRDTAPGSPEPVRRVRRVRPQEPSLELMLQAQCGLDFEADSDAPLPSDADAPGQAELIFKSEFEPLPSAMLAPPKPRPQTRPRPSPLHFLLSRVAMFFQWLALLMLLWPR